MDDSLPKANPLQCHPNQCHCTAGLCPKMNGLPIDTHHSRRLPLAQLHPPLLLLLVMMVPEQCEHRLRPLGFQVPASDSSPMTGAIPRSCQPPVSVRKKCRCPRVILRRRACLKSCPEWILCPRRLTYQGSHLHLLYHLLIHAIPVLRKPQARHRNCHDRNLTYPPFIAILSPKGPITRYRDNRADCLTLLVQVCHQSKILCVPAPHRYPSQPPVKSLLSARTL